MIGSLLLGATVSVRKSLGYHKAHRLVSERTLIGLVSLERSTVLFLVCALGPLIVLEVTLLPASEGKSKHSKGDLRSLLKGSAVW